MLEIRKEDGPRKGGYQLYVDGIYVSENDAWLLGGPDWSIGLDNPELSKKIGKLRISDFPITLTQLKFYLSYDGSGLAHEITIRNRENMDGHDILFGFTFDLMNWKQQWSIGEFGAEVERLIEGRPIAGVMFNLEDESIINGFRFTFPIEDPTFTIQAAIEKWADSVDQFMAEVESNLAARIHEDSIVIPFDFPEEIRVSCEQYLLYFVQFLKDLGVDANAEVRHEAERVLFSVTPTDGKEALGKLREVLNIYLELPSRIGYGTSMSLSSERRCCMNRKLCRFGYLKLKEQ